MKSSFTRCAKAGLAAVGNLTVISVVMRSDEWNSTDKIFHGLLLIAVLSVASLGVGSYLIQSERERYRQSKTNKIS